MHGAGLAAGAAGALAVQFRHHLFEVTALGKVPRMAPVGGRHDIVFVQNIANADGHGLLANG